ncbi:amidase family protein [Paenibacillus sp. GP183]|uniref:amidase family protein n=1 Tax=Paenibacillus sp. GP183 TaxID=1882751 RepID=UPI0008958C5F|nr:amidase family protein [Paenibacillus sp. GP183]SEB53402.1 Asp-tRNAAsn/Glu-tRNAGln amidotransferase A subunit [Paenibacillus sp. GP183]
MKSPVKKITLILFTVFLVLGVLQFPAYGKFGENDKQKAKPFVLEEATVESIQAAFANKTLTCTTLVKSYLARIEAYDKQGPALRAILTINPDALKIAEKMDEQYKDSKGRVGSLHCIPVILKDNFNTYDMPTSGGNVAMKDSVPTSDAFTVNKMRDAGAIILAKSNMQEFARGGVSISSLGGQVLNPYDLTRTPGGSSGGTGAAIASNFAVLGTGSDTGQSIRSPASANSLVGVRPTRGLVSRAGVMPNSFTQDEVGPITRTVNDAAKLLDVMVGYDPKDPITAFGVGRTPVSYAAGLNADSLKGARIGVMTNLYGDAERHAEVNKVMEQVIETMKDKGATIIYFTLPEYDKLSPVVATSNWEARSAMDKYFAELGSNAPVKSFRQLVDSKTASPDIQKTLESEIAVEDGLNNQTYKDRTLNRDKLRLAVSSKMAELQLDAILYPLQKVLVAPTGQTDQPERNGTLSNGTGFPAVTFPGGFSTPTKTAPLGIPVGAELLGRDYSEPLLLSLAYSFEQTAKIRKVPLSTPVLK